MTGGMESIVLKVVGVEFDTENISTKLVANEKNYKYTLIVPTS